MVVLQITPIMFEPKGASNSEPVTDVPDGNRCTYYGTLTTKSAPIVQKELQSLGAEIDKPSDIHFKKGKADLTGSEAWWLLSYQDAKDGGDPFEKWRVFTSRESAAPATPVTENDMLELDVAFGDVFGSNGFNETDL